MLATGLRSLGAVLLALVVLLSGGWSLRPSDRRPEAPPAAAPGRLREVAPPQAIQRQRQLLDSQDPALRILEPPSDTLLADAPWNLELSIDDWPAAKSDGPGLGPHVVVQLDERPPLRISDAADAAAAPVGPQRLTVPMPPLSPGSHRLTAYLARPWGEAVKAPQAWQQIRLHRVAPNPLALAPPGTPQLIDTTPTDLIDGEPALIDWLLLDTPLQPLNGDGPRWRLRITVNGDSFLVDRQTPVWLEGLHPGSNALVLELLDGLGEPLNPPFNTVVRELRLEPPGQRRWPIDLSAPPAEPGTDAGGEDGPQRQEQQGEDQPQEEEEEEEEAPQEVTADGPDAAPQPQASELAGPPPTVAAPAEEIGPAEHADAGDPGHGTAGLVPSPDGEVAEDGESVELPPGDYPSGPTFPEPAVPPAPAAAAPVAGPGSAREALNPDGSLRRPRANGLLARLRARFNG